MQQETHPCSYFVQHNMLMGSKIAQNYSKNMKRLEKQAIKISFYTNQLCSTKFWAQNFDIVWNISMPNINHKTKDKKKLAIKRDINACMIYIMNLWTKASIKGSSTIC